VKQRRALGGFAPLIHAMDAAVQSITAATAGNLAELRMELLDRIERVDRRTERLELNVNAMQLQLAGINRSLRAV
jgi:hypothetical protein